MQILGAEGASASHDGLQNFTSRFGQALSARSQSVFQQLLCRFEVHVGVAFVRGLHVFSRLGKMRLKAMEAVITPPIIAKDQEMGNFPPK